MNTSLKDAWWTPIEIKFDTLVVKTWWAASQQAKKILFPWGQYQTSTMWNVNLYQGNGYTMVETPYITSGTAWFMHASDAMEKSAVVHFVQAPMVEEKEVQDANNIFPTTSSFKYWIVNMPYDWVWSLWTV